MWPANGDAVNRTIEGEQALEDLYAEALRRWAPEVQAKVLPSLTAGGLPPDPDAVTEAQASWDATAEATVVVGAGLLWGMTLWHTYDGLGIPFPEAPPLPGPPVEYDPAALRAVARATEASEREVREIAAKVTADAALRAERDRVIDSHRTLASRIPGTIRVKLASALANVAAGADVRVAIKDVLVPGGADMRDVARQSGYQAAGVMNDAVVTAAKGTDEVLDKVWIATLDSKTRKTHWAADGQRAPLEGTFSVGRDDLRFPGDPRGTDQEVKNCRCRVGVLAPDESIPDEVDRHTERLDGRDSVARNRNGRSQAEEIKRREDEGNIRARDDAEGIGRVAAGGWTAPSEQEYSMSESRLDRQERVALETLEAEGIDTNAATFRTFTDAVIALVGEPTSDGRMLASDIELSFRDFPLPLMWTRQSSEGHMDAYTVGVLESAHVEGSQVLASGYMLNTPEADEAAAQIGHGVTGPSVDLAAVEWKLTDEKGTEISEEEWWDLPPDAKVFQTMTVAELIGTTLVATPAFGATTITLNADRETREAAVVASAAEDFRPRVYDHRLFSDPGLTGPTLPTMGEDGRIYGHLACFGACHRSIQSECVIAPRSATNYSHFHTSPALMLDDGSRLPVGRLTVGTGHAPDHLRGGPAMAHYDNTGSCFALVRVGEDAHGIWFSGVAAPWATVEQIEMGLSAPLSGDWRDFGAGLELIAALAVNTPGFAARGRDDDQGRPIALVASLGPAPDTERGGIEHLSLDSILAAVQTAVNEAFKRGEDKRDTDALLARAALVTTPPTPRDEIAAMLAGR